MIRGSVVGVFLFLLTAPLLADKKLDDRMMHAASILQEIRGSLDEKPPGVLHDAYALAIFPEFVRVGLVGGVKHGRGVLATRTASGQWSKPAFVRLTSGSVGLQFGVSMSQLLIVFKDPKAVEAISGGQLTLGADAGYAAGKLGGAAGAGTDNKLQNQIVAVSRSKGLFAGVALEGGVLRMERNANVEFYNSAIGLDGRRLLEDTETETPPVAQHLQIVIEESVPPLEENPNPAAGREVNIDKTDESGRAESDSSDSPAKSADSAANRAASGSPASTSPLARGQAPRSQNLAAASQGEWVTPDPQAAAVGFDAAPRHDPEGSRLGRELTSRAQKALWSGAKELAKQAIDNDSGVQGARLAAKAGEKALDATTPAPGSPKPPPRPAGPAIAQAGKPGQWVEVGDGELMPGSDIGRAGARAATSAGTDAAQIAADSGADVAQFAGAAGTDVAQVASSAGADLRKVAAIAESESFVGPPPPSEWPEEWVLQQAISGACEQGS